MLEVAGAVAGKVVGTVCLGALLGVGFWIGRKATNKVDAYLLTKDADFVKEVLKTEAAPAPAPVVA